MKHGTLPAALLAVLILVTLSCTDSSDSTASGGVGAAAFPGHRAVVVVLLDGVRVDHLGSYGDTTSSTPQLDAFADGAMRFDWSFSQAPDRLASMASLLTSLYPTTHGLVEANDRLVDEAVTLPEVLADAGLQTAAFLMDEVDLSDLGLGQGFDLFEAGPRALDEGLEWIAKNARSDFLLLIDAGSVRATAVDPGNALATYDEQLAALDNSTGRVLASLETAGLSDRATVAVLSLAGFDLGEHGTVGEPTIWAPVTRVPMLLQSPGLSPTGTIDKIVEVIDLAPTVLDLLGEDVPAEFQGQSLLPLIRGTGTPPYIAFGESATAGGQIYSALGGYRVIQHQADGSAELYSLAADPLETTDLAATEDNRVSVFEDHLSAWKKMVSVASLDPERRTEELDEEALEQLRSLGYIQ